MGDKIRKYVQDIASATIIDKERTAEKLTNISKASMAKDAQIDSITAQRKPLTDTIAHLSKSLANKEKTAAEKTATEETAAEEMVETALVLEVKDDSISPEIWAATACPTDIIQLVQSTTATTATAPTKRMGTKTKQLPQIAWMATISGRRRTGSSLPSTTTPVTKASQPPGDKSRGWIPMKMNTK